MEQEAFRLYKAEIARFEREWIPVAKHEEIVNGEIERVQADREGAA